MTNKRRDWLRGFGVLAVVVALAAFVWACQPAWPHDFYSAACCSGRDCTPAALGDVTWTPAGYRVLSTDEVIPLADPRIQYSPPGEPGYRLCIPSYNAKVRCLYIPEPEG